MAPMDSATEKTNLAGIAGDKKAIRVFIADDHPAFRIGLRAILEEDCDFAVVGEAASGAETVSFVRNLTPDILLLDDSMPNVSGLNVLQQLASSLVNIHTILVTAGIDRKQLIQALQLGAHGVIYKDASPLVYKKAIRCVMRGELWVERDVLTEWAHANAAAVNKFGLTPRELDIVREVLSGCSNKQIATTLQISEDTVKRHLSNIFDKTGVSNRLELSLFALNHNLLPDVHVPELHSGN